MSSRSRASLMERASSTAALARLNVVAQPASMRGTSQRAASSLSTPSGFAWSVTWATRATGSSVSLKVRTSSQAPPASGKRRLRKSVGVPSAGT